MPFSLLNELDDAQITPDTTSVDHFAAIAVLGWHELSRPIRSLWWSGCVAGIAMSLSAVGEAGLMALMPRALAWAPLVTSLGYCIGFLIVILGGLQLFTENTITPVLAVLPNPTKKTLKKLLRLWAVVFLANFFGVSAAMAFFAFTPALPPAVLAELKTLALHAMAPGALQVFCSAVMAGFFIAGLVWSSGESHKKSPLLIVLITYFMAILDLAHIIAGAGEAMFLVFTSQAAFSSVLTTYIAPTFLGNVVGGTLVFALVSYAQVHWELAEHVQRRLMLKYDRSR